jgi:hypothetical protein
VSQSDEQDGSAQGALEVHPQGLPDVTPKPLRKLLLTFQFLNMQIFAFCKRVDTLLGYFVGRVLLEAIISPWVK